MRLPHHVALTISGRAEVYKNFFVVLDTLARDVGRGDGDSFSHRPFTPTLMRNKILFLTGALHMDKAPFIDEYLPEFKFVVSKRPYYLQCNFDGMDPS